MLSGGGSMRIERDEKKGAAADEEHKRLERAEVERAAVAAESARARPDVGTKSGQEKTDDAVSAAQKQADRGGSWQKAQGAERAETPKSVEEVAKDAKEQA